MSGQLGSDRQILQAALDEWGFQAQADMVIEECAELQAELSRYWRGRSDEYDVMEELADVEIMLDQMRLAFDEHRINDHKREKMARLRERLIEAEEGDD